MVEPEGKLIYSCVVDGLPEEQRKMEDIPLEYRVYELPDTLAGVMVWGRIKDGVNGDRWYPNPKTRYLIANLLKQIDALYQQY